MYGICPKCNKNNILINLYGLPIISHVAEIERKGGFIISYPKRKSSAYLDKTDTKSQKNNKDKGLKNEKKEK